MAWLPDGEHFLKLSLFVLTQLTNVADTQTDRQTDRQTPLDSIGRAYASHRAAKTSSASHVNFDSFEVAWTERQFNACQTPRCMYLSIFNSFRVIRCISQCVSPKIAILPNFFSGDAPGAITLSVVWMEREFDAYKLSRWMCPSNYNHFSDRARYWSKIVIFSYHLAFDAPVRGVPVGISPPRLVRKN